MSIFVLFLKSETMGMSYKYYTVFISQSGTAAPTVKDIDNTMGRVILARTGTGTYTITKTNGFKVDKTVPKMDSYIDSDGNKMTLEHTDINTMTLKTYAAVDDTVLADGVLDDQYLTIQVFV